MFLSCSFFFVCIFSASFFLFFFSYYYYFDRQAERCESKTRLTASSEYANSDYFIIKFGFIVITLLCVTCCCASASACTLSSYLCICQISIVCLPYGIVVTPSKPPSLTESEIHFGLLNTHIPTLSDSIAIKVFFLIFFVR